jgi:hypothetical protein
MGQYGAMSGGKGGISGILGNVESATYTTRKGLSGSNPTLTAI